MVSGWLRLSRLTAGLLFILILGCASYVRSQDEPLPLILLQGRDLYYTTTTDFAPYEACTPDALIWNIGSVSPDGHRFTLNTFPAVFGQDYPQVGGGPLPVNIWMCDGQNLTQVASQPSDASFMSANQPDVYTSAGEPVWSPDGTQLAWSEMRVSSGAMAEWMTIYNIITGEAQSVQLDLPQPYGVPSARNLLWSQQGIITYGSFYYPDSGDAVDLSVFVFDTDGNQLNTFTPAAPAENEIMLHTLLLQGEQDKIGILWSQSGWWIFEPLTGEGEPLENGLPELYSPLKPPGTSLLFESFLNESTYFTVMTSTQFYIDDGGNVVQYQIPPALATQPIISISPTGAIGYATERGVEIWDDGRYEFAVAPGSTIDNRLLWGPRAWRIRPGELIAFPSDMPDVTASPPVTSETDQSCPSNAPVRLEVNQQGTVVDPVPNNVRQSPSLNAPTVGQIATGSIFTVLAGPVCADGFVWYRIDFDGLIGWTVEGDGATYWLAPLQ